MHKQIDDVEFTLFDTETTGLDPHGGDRIVEIAAVRIKGGSRISDFQALINPGRPVSEAAFRVNHITQDMLEAADDAKRVIPRFVEFAKDSCLCSYNAAFDMSFLNNELELLGFSRWEDVLVVDMLKMARRLLPGLERYALWFIADHLGIKTRQEHRALADVELSLEVFYKFRSLLQAKGISDFINFANLFSISQKFIESVHNQKIAEIQEAISLGSRLMIKYISASGQVSQREVVPQEIRMENKQLYLAGHCCLRNQKRSFKLDGILHLQII